MRALTGHDIVHIWEAGTWQRPGDLALTILARATPGVSRDELASLSLGQRDQRLLALHEATFGPQLAGQGRCPACDGQVVFTVNTADLGVSSPGPLSPQTELPTGEGYDMVFRLPNSLDLAAIAGCDSVESARRMLLQRCVTSVTRDGAAVPVDALPEQVTTLLEEHMAQQDPLADIELELTCPDCGHRWQAALDIASFLWSEVSAQARRLLLEVHALARAYGWREADILSMSAARRQLYLEMVG